MGDGRTLTSSEFAVEHTYSDPGTYTVNVSTTNGCGNTASESFQVTVTGDPCNSTGIANKMQNGMGFTVYPNPATVVIYIQDSQRDSWITEATLTNPTGQLVKQARNNGSAIIPINVEELPKGLYIL